MRPSISADGRYVAFHSLATNLVPGDENGQPDVFVHDRETGVTERVSVSSEGVEGNESSRYAFISGDGRYVAFLSFASTLVPPDANPLPDVFVHDRETGVTERVSVGSDNAEGNHISQQPSISTDGRYVAFHSTASNLVPGDTNGSQDVFMRDRGPSVGVGGLSVVPKGDTVSVSGWATFSGAVISSAEDAAGDASPGAGETGAELVGASLTYPSRAGGPPGEPASGVPAGRDNGGRPGGRHRDG